MINSTRRAKKFEMKYGFFDGVCESEQQEAELMFFIVTIMLTPSRIKQFQPSRVATP
jgi:hypothetical protein